MPTTEIWSCAVSFLFSCKTSFTKLEKENQKGTKALTLLKTALDGIRIMCSSSEKLLVLQKRSFKTELLLATELLD